MDSYKPEFPKRKKVWVNESQISYLSVGEGKEALVCLPGWPSSSLLFLPFFDQLKHSNLRLIAPDLPGWSGESYDPKRRFSVNGYAKLIVGFLKEMNLKQVNLLGYSMGGVIAEQVYYRLSHSVQKLILISPPYTLSSIYRSYRHRMELYKLLGNVPVVTKTLVQWYRWFFFQLNLIIARRGSTYYLPLVHALMEDSTTIDGQAIFTSILEVDGFARNVKKLKRVRGLTIYGEKEPDFVMSGTDYFRQVWHRNVILPSADHGHIFYEPERSSRLVREFVVN